MVFHAARCCPHEGLFVGRVEVLILRHMSGPSTSQDGSKNFPNT